MESGHRVRRRAASFAACGASQTAGWRFKLLTTRPCKTLCRMRGVPHELDAACNWFLARCPLVPRHESVADVDTPGAKIGRRADGLVVRIRQRVNDDADDPDHHGDWFGARVRARG